MQESIDINPRIRTQRAVMELFLREVGGDKKSALETYMEKYAPCFDDVFTGHEHDKPEDLLNALRKKVGTLH